VPLAILMGAADDWTPPKPCTDLAARFPAIHMHLYPGVYHDFDVPHDPVHLIHHLPYTLHHTGTAHAGENVTARSEALVAVPLILDRLGTVGGSKESEGRLLFCKKEAKNFCLSWPWAVSPA